MCAHTNTDLTHTTRRRALLDSHAHTTTTNTTTHTQECAKRVEADTTGHKHCTGWAFDYWSCIDKCVSVLFVFLFPVLLAGG